eukprot:TRINITY_DN4733_c0_g1_i1.p1 TRINITY_DN4733_c0_g1~~TRINITY_DN4733_c0_g1_i1.p1  ORF type:complete len:384 (+),score=37.28 TRINITY_DN4733_c0_g1_i1:19-1170(+)
MSSILSLSQPIVARCVFCAVAVLLALCFRSVESSFAMNGMTFVSDKYCPNVTFDSPKSFRSLEHLATTGANSVAVVVTEYMQYHNSTKVFPIYTPIYSSYYTYITATTSSLEAVIRKAHSLGLKVMLKPQVDLIDDPKHWRGDIGHGFNATLWKSWFSSYGEMLMKYVRLAERTDVEVVSVSCELIEASKQDAHWRELIARVRQEYHGQLTSAANWGWLNATGGEETNKTWWDAVDFIGIDAYYQLPALINVTDPSLHQMIAAWAPVVQRALNLSTFWSRPVVFTEIGTCSGDCARGTKATFQGLMGQALSYDAVMKVFSAYPSWFHGMYWWCWFSDPAMGGSKDDCITPQYKPAETVLREFYGASRPAPPAPSYEPVCACTV